MKIEGQNIPAFEVAHQMELLKAAIELRKYEKYTDPKTEREKTRIISTAKEAEAEINAIFEEFHGMYGVRIV